MKPKWIRRLVKAVSPDFWYEVETFNLEDGTKTTHVLHSNETQMRMLEPHKHWECQFPGRDLEGCLITEEGFNKLHKEWCDLSSKL